MNEMSDDDESGQGHDEIGSLGEEATRLLGSLAAWAREHGSDVGSGVEDLAGQVSGSWHDLDAHLATGSAECTLCPLCRTVQVVRGLNPEVKTHLTSAATSLMQAAIAMMASPAGAGPRDRQAPVEHIDLEDNWPQRPSGEEGGV